MTKPPPSARIYAIVARAARRALIFRRGPAKLARLLLWDLANDRIIPGQWFKGRIYERRCDLTPEGDGLVYSAGSHRRPLYSWTAISRPPYLTALALWPNIGAAGGGLFEAPYLLHLDRVGSLDVRFAAPDRLIIQPLSTSSEITPLEQVERMRLQRDSWTTVDDGATWDGSDPAVAYWKFDPPLRMRKAHRRNAAWLLETRLHAIREHQGRVWAQTAALVDRAGRPITEFGSIDWTDLDHNGDVLLSKEARLLRVRRGMHEPQLVADLNDMAFEEIKAPEWASKWY
ncbi:MAG TPA: hypothetical protein VKS60_07850 [Stellaceae bacterium]|nr:hypothetical protein [Stellaceae bacterium]